MNRWLREYQYARTPSLACPRIPVAVTGDVSLGEEGTSGQALTRGMLGVQTVGRAVEVYRVRGEAEMAKRLKRKQKRKREKGKDEDIAGEGEGVTAADELELATVVRTKAKTRG